jgi:hypothetical protein
VGGSSGVRVDAAEVDERMTEDAWEIRCFWKSATEGSPMPWTTHSSHSSEQQARSAAQNVFDTYQDMGPLTIDSVEIRGPGGEWKQFLSTADAGEPGPRGAGRSPRQWR